MKIITTFLLLLFLTACQDQSHQNNKALEVFNITNPKDSYTLKLSDLNVADIEYIPLDTKDTFLIGIINSVVVSDEDIYIHCRKSAILRFGKDGNYKNQIGNLGRGPKEYIGVYNFTIDPISQDLYINSLADKEIYSFTKQGEFITSFKAPQGTLSIMFSDGNILCHRPYSMGDNESFLVMVDKNGDTKINFPNFIYKVEFNTRYGYISEIIWFRFKKNLFIKDIYNDTVFLYNNNQFTPQYILDHGGKTITPEARKQLDTEDKFLELGAKYAIEVKVWRFSDYIISEFMYNNKLYIYTANLQENIEYFANYKTGIINDIDGGPNLRYVNIDYYDDNTIISWIDAYELISYVNSNQFKNSTPKYPEKKKQLEQLANSLNENDNPVLMLVKLKE